MANRLLAAMTMVSRDQTKAAIYWLGCHWMRQWPRSQQVWEPVRASHIPLCSWHSPKFIVQSLLEKCPFSFTLYPEFNIDGSSSWNKHSGIHHPWVRRWSLLRTLLFAYTDAFSTGWSVCFSLNKAEKIQCSVLHSSEGTWSLVITPKPAGVMESQGDLRPSRLSWGLAETSRRWCRSPGFLAGFALWDNVGRGFPVFWLRAKDLICKITALCLVQKPWKNEAWDDPFTGWVLWGASTVHYLPQADVSIQSLFSDRTSAPLNLLQPYA